MFIVTDKHGNDLELDDDDTIPDGCTLRVEARFMDAAAARAARVFVDDAAPRYDVHRAGPKPGTAQQLARRRNGYTAMIQRNCDAWRHAAPLVDAIPTQTGPKPAARVRGMDPVLQGMTQAQWEEYLRKLRASAGGANDARRAAWERQRAQLTERWRNPA